MCAFYLSISLYAIIHHHHHHHHHQHYYFCRLPLTIVIVIALNFVRQQQIYMFIAKVCGKQKLNIKYGLS